MANLKQVYNETMVQDLQKKLAYSNVMMVPKLSSVVLNMGIGQAATDKKLVDHASSDLTAIAGQKAMITKTKKSIAGFKIRDGWPIGCKVTLRGDRMYDFIERLLHVALPRTRDFRGLSVKSFDGMGNYNFGLKEQIVFPEIDYDKIDALRGLNVTITTTAKDNKAGLALLLAFGFPFRDYKEGKEG